MCLVPELFHFVSLHSFLYSDYEYFAWFATPRDDRTQEMFRRVLRWKGLTRAIGRMGGVDHIWNRWSANDDFADFDNRRLVTRAFLLHLRAPCTYPILDTNVWRARCRMHPDAGLPAHFHRWDEHYIHGYAPFFNQLYQEVHQHIVCPQIDGVDEEIVKRRVLDRALWEFGRMPQPNG